MLTCVWGLRLAVHIGRRNRGKPEDPRYVEILERAKSNPVAHLVRKVYVPQAVILWVVSWPVQLGQYGFAAGVLSIVVTALGVLSWAVGLFFETVGDAQLAAFKADPANKGKVMDRGPVALHAAPQLLRRRGASGGGSRCSRCTTPAGLIGLVSAALMTWLLAKGTGAALLERSIGKRRPGYAEYVQRTSGFIPLPPKKDHFG